MLSSISALEAPPYSPGTNWLSGSVGMPPVRTCATGRIAHDFYDGELGEARTGRTAGVGEVNLDLTYYPMRCPVAELIDILSLIGDNPT